MRLRVEFPHKRVVEVEGSTAEALDMFKKVAVLIAPEYCRFTSGVRTAPVVPMPGRVEVTG